MKKFIACSGVWSTGLFPTILENAAQSKTKSRMFERNPKRWPDIW
jgi:hypothetical protein